MGKDVSCGIPVPSSSPNLLIRGTQVPDIALSPFLISIIFPDAEWVHGITGCISVGRLRPAEKQVYLPQMHASGSPYSPGVFASQRHTRREVSRLWATEVLLHRSYSQRPSICCLRPSLETDLCICYTNGIFRQHPWYNLQPFIKIINIYIFNESPAAIP